MAPRGRRITFDIIFFIPFWRLSVSSAMPIYRDLMARRATASLNASGLSIVTVVVLGPMYLTLNLLMCELSRGPKSWSMPAGAGAADQWICPRLTLNGPL
jgi:hypothetical protein